MSEPRHPLGLTEHERAEALRRFQDIRPSLEDGVSFAQTARQLGVATRTVQRWVRRCGRVRRRR